MNLLELDSYRLHDAINFHHDLNPQIWGHNDSMRSNVKKALLNISNDFIVFLGLTDLAVADITLSGSNAGYSYTPYSDIDLHLLVDFTQINNDDVYRELFDAKKYQYNDQHDIKIRGYEVEVYVQDASQQHSSLGEYSIVNDDWNKIPTKKRANLDDNATKAKYEKLREFILLALASEDESQINQATETIKRYRKAGLAESGEFGPENLAFKILRKKGLVKKLWDKKAELEDKRMSI
jgi:hypothetical protein